MKKYRLVITPGEPAGVGPDLVIQLAQYNWPVEVVVCADDKLLKDRATLLDIPLSLLPYKSLNTPIPQKENTLTLLPIPLSDTVIPGQLHTKNSDYVIKTLERACDGCLNGEFSGLITGPVNKEVINKAGINFIGHTEFLQERTCIKRVVMMLVTEKMRVATLTTHLPIKEISSVITQELLYETIIILNNDLQKKFGILQPYILVCGLNPHAGEGGYIGTEEINIIIPVLKKLQLNGINLSGPFPADSLFQKKNLDNADVILAMYHDQGFPVIKYQGFNRGVNVTLGLPFIRTSVDHGTAIDLAGKRKANAESFIAALKLAIKIAVNT